MSNGASGGWRTNQQNRAIGLIDSYLSLQGQNNLNDAQQTKNWVYGLAHYLPEGGLDNISDPVELDRIHKNITDYNNRLLKGPNRKDYNQSEAFHIIKENLTKVTNQKNLLSTIDGDFERLRLSNDFITLPSYLTRKATSSLVGTYDQTSWKQYSTINKAGETIISTTDFWKALNEESVKGNLKLNDDKTNKEILEFNQGMVELFTERVADTQSQREAFSSKYNKLLSSASNQELMDMNAYSKNIQAIRKRESALLYEYAQTGNQPFRNPDYGLAYHQAVEEDEFRPIAEHNLKLETQKADSALRDRKAIDKTYNKLLALEDIVTGNMPTDSELSKVNSETNPFGHTYYSHTMQDPDSGELIIGWSKSANEIVDEFLPAYFESIDNLLEMEDRYKNATGFEYNPSSNLVGPSGSSLLKREENVAKSVRDKKKRQNQQNNKNNNTSNATNLNQTTSSTVNNGRFVNPSGEEYGTLSAVGVLTLDETKLPEFPTEGARIAFLKGLQNTPGVTAVEFIDPSATLSGPHESDDFAYLQEPNISNSESWLVQDPTALDGLVVKHSGKHYVSGLSMGGHGEGVKTITNSVNNIFTEEDINIKAEFGLNKSEYKNLPIEVKHRIDKVFKYFLKSGKINQTMTSRITGGMESTYTNIGPAGFYLGLDDDQKRNVLGKHLYNYLEKGDGKALAMYRRNVTKSGDMRYNASLNPHYTEDQRVKAGRILFKPISDNIPSVSADGNGTFMPNFSRQEDANIISNHLNMAPETFAMLDVIAQYENSSKDNKAINFNTDMTADVGLYQINERWVNARGSKNTYEFQADGTKDPVYKMIQGYMETIIPGWSKLGVDDNRTRQRFLQNQYINTSIAKILLENRFPGDIKKGALQWSAIQNLPEDVKSDLGLSDATFGLYKTDEMSRIIQAHQQALKVDPSINEDAFEWLDALDKDEQTKIVGRDVSSVTRIKIKSGDTLSRIAEQYGVTVDSLLASNPQIKSADKIKIGQTIKIDLRTKKDTSIDATTLPSINVGAQPSTIVKEGTTKDVDKDINFNLNPFGKPPKPEFTVKELEGMITTLNKNLKNVKDSKQKSHIRETISKREDEIRILKTYYQDTE